jgi:hypothetical protein
MQVIINLICAMQLYVSLTEAVKKGLSSHNHGTKSAIEKALF